MTTIKFSRRALAVAISSFGMMGSGVASAAPNLHLDLGGGLGYYTNPAQVSVDEESDVAALAHANLTWRDPTGSLAPDVSYRVEQRDYLDNVEDDETAIDGRAALRWAALPRLLDVIVQHQISQTQTDLRTPDTPSNRERRSIVTGGVNGYLRLSGVDSVVISPRYTDITYSESTQSDSQRGTVDVAWRHELDELSTFSVSAGAGQVRFDDSLQDYDSQTIQTGYEATLSRLNYSVAVGATRFDRDQLDDVDGHLLRAGLNYRGDGFDVGGTLVSELTDSSIGLASNEFGLGDFTANDSNFDQADVLERSQLDLYWRQQLTAASSLNFGVGASRDDYETLLEDQDTAYAEAGYQYTLNAFWSLAASGRYERTDFTDDPLDRDQRDTTFEVSALYRFNPRLDVQLSLIREERDASLDSDDYSGNIVMLDFNYRLF